MEERAGTKLASSKSPVEDPLFELLRRCHRSELLALAKVLRIKPAGQGLSDLSRSLANKLRREGGNGIVNVVVRQGEGPAYDRILRRLARRCKVPFNPDPETTELALLTWFMEAAWSKMSPEERTHLWKQMNMQPPVPPDGPEAMRAAHIQLGMQFGYFAGSAVVAAASPVASMLLAPFGPLLGCLGVFLLSQPKDRVLVPAVLHVAQLRQAVRHRVTIGVVGSPSCGKDAAIKAIFGIDSGNVNPVAGSTREVEITRSTHATALYVVNTPGLGDVMQSVTEEARQVLDLIDVYVYVVNAQGGVQAREKDDWKRCRDSGRPVLAVVNKIDTLRESDRERFLADARKKLGAPEQDFLATAFDPLPQLADAPIGLQAVRDWIQSHLVALGKDPSELPWESGDAA